MKNDVKYIQEIVGQGLQATYELMNLDNIDERFFNVADSCIMQIKEINLISENVSMEDVQTLFIVAYCMGKAVEKQRQKSPIANYIKEKEMIGIHYTVDGQEKGTFVPKDFNNKKIKKVISSIEGQEFKGNFKKLSEFEMKKTLKQIDSTTKILN